MFRVSQFDPPWWRHQMETFSALLALCAGNSPVSGEFPAQRPVTRSFDVSLDLRVDKRLSKQSWGWWFETLSRSLCRHRNEIICIFQASVIKTCVISLDLSSGKNNGYFCYIFLSSAFSVTSLAVTSHELLHVLPRDLLEKKKTIRSSDSMRQRRAAHMYDHAS